MTEKHKKFKMLYDEHHLAFGRYCQAQGFGIIDAEDLMSESLLKAYEGIHRLKDEQAFLGFLISIARNIIKNKLRRKKFWGAYSEKQSLEILDSTLDAEQKLDIQFLYKALDLLPKAQKEALILFEISGYAIKEICEIQKASESAVKSRLKRGREGLAEILKNPELGTESVLSPSKLLARVFL